MAAAKQTFKGTLADYTALNNDISHGKFSPLYLLMGDEPFFIDQLSDMLLANVIPPEAQAFNQVVVYGKDCDGVALCNMCRQMPMMGNRQLIVIKEAQGLKKLDQLVNYTKHAVESTILVLCHKEKSLDKRSQLYKSILENGTVFESVKPRDYEVGSWLSSYITQCGLTIDQRTLQLMTDYLGSDLSKIAGEIDKLHTAMPIGQRQITPEVVEENIGISRDYNIFELTKALSERNTLKAMQISDYFARNPKSTPLVVSISRIHAHFEKVFRYNYALWLAKKRSQPMPTEQDLCKLLKLSSPYFLKEYGQAAANYTMPKLFSIFELLREYDMKQKGINRGSLDDGELLRELLLKILN